MSELRQNTHYALFYFLVNTAGIYFQKKKNHLIRLLLIQVTPEAIPTEPF